jgi:hypothetical protein
MDLGPGVWAGSNGPHIHGIYPTWQLQLEQAGFGGSNLLGLLVFRGQCERMAIGDDTPEVLAMPGGMGDGLPAAN